MPQSVAILIFDPHGRVLVLRRGPTDPWKPGHWNFPGGGVEVGETPQQAAVREVYEEAGIAIRPTDLHYSFSFRRPGGGTHLLWVKLREVPRVELLDREHDSFQWAFLTRLPSPVIPGLPFIVQQLTGSSNYGDAASDYSKAAGVVRTPDEAMQVTLTSRANWERGIPEQYPVAMNIDQLSERHKTGLVLAGSEGIESRNAVPLPGRSGDTLRGKTLYWLPAPSTNYTKKDRTKEDVNFIVIHAVEGRTGFNLLEADGRASAHYLVQTNGDVVQIVDEKDKAWHAGNSRMNTQSIGIEHSGYSYVRGGGSAGGMWGDTLLRASAKLTASIAKRWDIPIDRKHIIGHVSVAGQTHTDPGPYWPWDRYLWMVRWYRYRWPFLASTTVFTGLSIAGLRWHRKHKS
tara:strand:- start:4004 stop:5209 length:1206 start_codon:yes stop_codon:yes gene_type:complete